MTQRTVSVIGATGFIGSAVVRAAPRSVRVRRHSRAGFATRQASDVIGDIREADVQRRVAADADAIVHCAPYIGPDLALAEQINAVATATIVRAADPTTHFLYVSTTGVYGDGPFLAADEQTPLAPTSVTSRTRVQAEAVVRENGGIVLRPHLVVGEGDRYVRPALKHYWELAGGLPHPAPLASVITADALAAQVWKLLASGDFAGEALNADHGAPVPLPTLVGGYGRMARPLDRRYVFNALRAQGIGRHHALMFTHDSTFSSKLAG